MNKSILLLLFVLILGSCGEDEPQTEEVAECDGSLSVLVDGETYTYDNPVGASLAFNEPTNNHELNLVWTSGQGSIGIQLLLDLGTEDCINVGRINSSSLPAGVSIFSLQYFDITGKEGSVSNVFQDPNASGWVEIIKCDGPNNMISVDFEFTGVSGDGNSEVIVKNGSSKDICFSRTK